MRLANARSLLNIILSMSRWWTRKWQSRRAAGSERPWTPQNQVGPKTAPLCPFESTSKPLGTALRPSVVRGKEHSPKDTPKQPIAPSQADLLCKVGPAAMQWLSMRTIPVPKQRVLCLPDRLCVGIWSSWLVTSPANPWFRQSLILR